jgi:hypothetical protein
MLPNFQRSLFKKELLSRLKYWLSPESKNEFYKNIPFKPEMGIQRVDNGYYYLSNKLVSFSDLTNGLVVRMRSYKTTKDWDCYNDLYKQSLEKGIRIDVPLYKEMITDHLGNTWEYAEIRSPENQYGSNLYDILFSDSHKTLEEEKDFYLTNDWQLPQASDGIKSSAKELFEIYIDQFVIVAGLASSIAEKNNSSLPLGIANMSTLYRDSNGYFWSDFDHNTWTTTKSNLISSALSDFESTTYFAEKSGLLDSVVRENLIKYAREKWTAI